jgi:membrane dipeptidase
MSVPDMNPARVPVADLHCDLLSYLAFYPDRDALCDRIGCGLPFLQAGNVRLQVMAMYTSVIPDEPDFALRQSLLYRDLVERYDNQMVALEAGMELEKLEAAGKVGILAAIENASGFCTDEEPLEKGLQNLNQIIANCGRLLYISLTHAGENRFGGGNGTAPGLKPDGEVLLEYLSGKQIAIDLAHTSDALAYGILDFINRRNLEIPVIASHSNFRKVHGHIRNLPDELVQEVINRKGLIGINLLKHMIGSRNNPHDLHDHIRYGLLNGAEDCLAFGADFFYSSAVAAGTEQPVFHDEHQNAGLYPTLLAQMSDYMSNEQVEKLSYANVMKFINRIWA